MAEVIVMYTLLLKKKVLRGKIDAPDISPETLQ
jgi:hypothetical protein